MPPSQPAPPAAPPAAEARGRPQTCQRVAQPNAVIPLIVMDDVPLTDAIRNLARQAGLNYMLDPKIGYGQIGRGRQTHAPALRVTPLGEHHRRAGAHCPAQ